LYFRKQNNKERKNDRQREKEKRREEKRERREKREEKRKSENSVLIIGKFRQKSSSLLFFQRSDKALNGVYRCKL